MRRNHRMAASALETLCLLAGLCFLFLLIRFDAFSRAAMDRSNSSGPSELDRRFIDSNQNIGRPRTFDDRFLPFPKQSELDENSAGQTKFGTVIGPNGPEILYRGEWGDQPQGNLPASSFPASTARDLSPRQGQPVELVDPYASWESLLPDHD